MRSPAELATSISEKDLRSELNNLSDDAKFYLRYYWPFWARPNQLPPDGDWFVWLLMAGRGFGKTRTGVEWVHRRAMDGNEDRWIALIAETPGDARDDIIEGPGGLLRNTHPSETPNYEPSKRRVTWPTGAYATIYSGANPEQLRGFSGDTALCDELASWKYSKEAWDNLMFGLREAKVESPKVCVATTPKPIAVIRDLHERCEKRQRYVLTTGSSYDNKANLSPIYYEEVISPYEGTTLGAQEIHAQLLDEMPGALWDRTMIERSRADFPPLHALEQVAIGVDPAATSHEDSDETGIIVGGVWKGTPYILSDLSDRMKPGVWADRVVGAYEEWSADIVVAEKNNGGEMVEHTVHTADATVPVKLVHASRGKHTRAQPVASLYERGQVKHCVRSDELEDQMCTWVPGEDSPDRLDALVWLLTHLALKGRKDPSASPVGFGQSNPWRM